jgi:PAS domain S-box-containing protein
MDGNGEQSAEDLYERAPCGYLSATPDGSLVRVNETFLRWTGYSREQLVGVKRFQDLLTPGARIYHETHYAPLLRMQGSVREIAVDVVCADRRRLPVLINSVLLTDSGGEPRMVRTTLFDATERKSYERELLAARDRERVARKQIELLQRITAALAAASGAEEIAEAVTGELMTAFDAQRVEVEGEFEPGPEFDDAGAARLALEAAPDAREGLLRLELAEPRPFEPDERAFLIAVARQTALALERSRLYEETRDIAYTLQRSLIAGTPPDDPRFEITTLYQPAVKHLEIGGDWHDAFALPDGKVGIAVGDVVGRGLRAAGAMGQLRSAVRALAGAGMGPEAVIGHLDTFVEQVEAAQYATLAYAEVDPATGEVVIALAGHLPPILRFGGAPEVYLGGRSTPLGVATSAMPRTQARLTLAPGAGFVLYTDGLVERRGESIDVGIERLRQAIGDRPAVRPQELVDTLIEGDASEDDVCILVFRRT